MRRVADQRADDLEALDYRLLHRSLLMHMNADQAARLLIYVVLSGAGTATQYLNSSHWVSHLRDARTRVGSAVRRQTLSNYYNTPAFS